MKSLYLNRWFRDLRRSDRGRRKLHNLRADALLRVVRDQTLGAMDLLDLENTDFSRNWQNSRKTIGGRSWQQLGKPISYSSGTTATSKASFSI